MNKKIFFSKKMPNNDLLKPQDVINQWGVQGLCDAADDYFKSITDIVPLLNKPFHSIAEGPYLLVKLGQLLSGLRLGKAMTVLDFGAGSCWVSRFLNELSCATISLDPSRTALKIGEELFQRFPVMGKTIAAPRFLPFDGYTIDLPDHSVDRIICFDAFHHIPNPDVILAEFFRVLKPGGIAGFAEVGPHHSQSPQSQYEMRHFRVLENDVVLEHIKKITEKIGFTELYCKLFTHPDLEMDYPSYLRMARKKKIPKPIAQYITRSMNDFPIFFLVKGKYMPDSRNHIGLAHQLTISPTAINAFVNIPLSVSVTIKNSGSALWLHENIQDIGVVNLGVHLLAADGTLVNHDFLRFNLGKPVYPGETVQKTVKIVMPQPGQFKLVFDLVAEHICWFEINNSLPVTLTVHVN